MASRSVAPSTVWTGKYFTILCPLFFFFVLEYIYKDQLLKTRTDSDKSGKSLRDSAGTVLVTHTMHVNFS